MEGRKEKEPCANKALSKRNAYFIGMQLLSIDGLLHSMYYTTNDILFYSELFLLVLLSGLFCFNALTAS